MAAADSLGVSGRAFLASKTPNSVMTQEELIISVTKGSIADQAVDAIVNSTGPDFDLTQGALSNIILQRAGRHLQNQLTRRAARIKDLRCGTVVTTDGFNLPASVVFHGFLKHWSDGLDDARYVLCRFIWNCLTKASYKKLKSIAFPALGTGFLCFPSFTVVDCLFSEADRFSSTNLDTTLKEIRFIVYDRDHEIFEAFKRKLEQIQYRPASQSQATLLSMTFKTLGISYPPSWKPPSPGKPCETKILDSSDSDFKMVWRKFIETKGKVRTRNVKIERIENRALYRQYTVFKSNMEKRNGKYIENERILWHGTTKESVNNICLGGFNRSYCGKNATKYGKGVYFASDFECSTQDRYSPPDSTGTKYVFMCAVLTGLFTVGNDQMLEPPELRPGTDVRHDSTADDIVYPGIFVIYKDAQAYPQYLVSFT